MRNSQSGRFQALAASLSKWFAASKRRRTDAVGHSIELFEGRLLLTEFTVLSNADSGPDTLRQAILDANANPGTDSIIFNLGPSHLTIKPLSLLPAITDPVDINGGSQPGYINAPLIVLDGSKFTVDTFVIKTGLQIATHDSTISGLAVQNFYYCVQIGGEGTSGVTGNRIESSYLGLNPDGSATLNFDNRAGVVIDNGASDNVIGGSSGQGNVISGNTLGVYVEGPVTTGNVITGNAIGTAADRSPGHGNSDGIRVYNATNTLIGGLEPGAGNLISGNEDNGIDIGGQTASGNIIQGNRIGTNDAGTISEGTTALFSAIGLDDGAHDNLIGGTSSAARNIIAAGQTGISFGFGTQHNTAQGNYVNVDITGTKALQNVSDGISFFFSNDNLIGGTEPGAGNVISGAFLYGLRIENTSSGNTVQGNFIGTNASGTAAIPNQNGLRIAGASNNIVGGTTAGAANVISGNEQDGIDLAGPTTMNNVIRGNFIGVLTDGTSPLANGYSGIDLSYGASSNQIGGRTPGAGNVIAHNAGRAIRVFSNNTVDNSFIGNSIFGNGYFAIDLSQEQDLGPRTPNDPKDADNGPNGLQNCPILTSSVISDGTLTVNGTLNSTPNSSFDIDLYASESADSQGYPQGQIWLGFQTVNTDAHGDVAFTIVLPVNAPSSDMITAIATGAESGSSEFSVIPGEPGVQMSDPPVLTVTVTPIQYRTGQPPVLIAGDAVVADPDTSNFDGARLVVTMVPQGKGKERLAIRNQGTAAGQISVTKGIVHSGGTAIGTVSGGKGKKSLVVTFSGNVDLATVESVIRNVTFQNSAKRTKSTSKTLRIELVDRDQNSSNPVERTINYL
jgi:hypothetical protein